MTSLSERRSLHTGWEQRSCARGGVELRETRSAAGLAGWELSGYASTFDDPYSVFDQLGEYTEVVRRGAFTQTLAAPADVVLRLDHEGMALARTKAGTLRLDQDGRGLHLAADLDPANPTAGAIRSAVERGDLDAFSFAFRATGQTWSPDYMKRELLGVDLGGGDVSIVAFAANPATAGSATLRGKYSTDDLKALKAKGHTLPGTTSYPIDDAEDLDKAIHAVGRGGADHDAIRRYIIGRAKALGLSSKIPDNWNADGSLKNAAAAGGPGESRAPASHPPFKGTHSHNHPTGKSTGPASHTHSHEHSNDSIHSTHVHSPQAAIAAIANADIASGSLDEPSSESLSALQAAVHGLPDFSLEARLMLLRLAAPRPEVLTSSEMLARALAQGNEADAIIRRRLEKEKNRDR